MACGLGVLLTGYAAWATRTVPAGVGPLLDSLNRDDRFVLRGSWVVHQDRPIALLPNLRAQSWLGLSFLALLPLVYFLRRGFSPARAVTYVYGAALVGLSFAAVIADENFGGADPGPDRLSPAAHRAWLDLYPPGYAAVHVVALVGMIGCVFLACLLLDQASGRAFFAHRSAPRRRVVRAGHPRLRGGHDPKPGPGPAHGSGSGSGSG